MVAERALEIGVMKEIAGASSAGSVSNSLIVLSRRLGGFHIFRIPLQRSVPAVTVSHRTLPPGPPRNPWPRLLSQAPAHSSRATSISATLRASSAWIHVPRPQSTEIASLRAHSRRLPPQLRVFRSKPTVHSVRPHIDPLVFVQSFLAPVPVLLRPSLFQS